MTSMSPSDPEQFDAIVMATGFDAMAGSLLAVDIRGRKGLTLRAKWAEVASKDYEGFVFG